MRRLLGCLPLCLLLSCSLAHDNPGRLHVEPITRPDPARRPVEPAEMARLVKDDPVAFLERSIDHYAATVKAYRATLVKQERVGGTLYPPEVIQVSFREKPFSVLMDWQDGARLARKSLYVEGENSGRMLVLPAGWRAIVGVVAADTGDYRAKNHTRYPITEFGLLTGTQRTLKSWKAARERGELKVRFLGTESPEELKKRPCWVVERVERPSRDPEGITTTTFYFDPTTYLQLGSILLDEKGELVGKYYFRDLEVNPAFAEDTFTREHLRKK